MGMSIEDCISELTWVRKVNEEILKTDAKEIDVNSAWIEHWKKVVKSLDTAIENMRKYQRIQETMNRWYEDKTWEFDTSYLYEIGEILEDGNDD